MDQDQLMFQAAQETRTRRREHSGSDPLRMGAYEIARLMSEAGMNFADIVDHSDLRDAALGILFDARAHVTDLEEARAMIGMIGELTAAGADSVRAGIR